MKQYLLGIYRNKKVPLPVVFHLTQAVGALTLHTVRNLYFDLGVKNARNHYMASLLA
nr:MAG TPA: hypothetical protein [Caudoviricetes sp.]